MKNTIRLFIAFDIPEKIRYILQQVQDKLKKKISLVKWVEKENFHLTLIFLGNQEKEKIKSIKEVINLVKTRVSFPFRLTLEKIDGFPKFQKARVIFVKIGDKKNDLLSVVDFLKQNLKSLKISFDDKPFVSHITLGRSKKFIDLSKIFLPKIEKIEFFVNKISLKESKLTSKGPVYRSL